MTLKNKDKDIDTGVWNFRKVLMADNNRSRLLLLLKYLQKNTDDEHVIVAQLSRQKSKIFIMN